MRGRPVGGGAFAIAHRQAGVGDGVPGRGFGEPEENAADGRCAGVRDLGASGGSAEGLCFVSDSGWSFWCVVVVFGCLGVVFVVLGVLLLLLLLLLLWLIVVVHMYTGLFFGRLCFYLYPEAYSLDVCVVCWPFLKLGSAGGLLCPMAIAAGGICSSMF